jgi:hypothetical protein
MNCEKCKELLVAYVEGLLHKEQKQAIESHLNTCPPCRAELTQLIALRDRLAANGKALAESDLENKVLNRIVREQSSKLEVSKFSKQIQLWRIIMKSRIIKFAAVAVVIIAMALSTNLLDKSVTPAYALEQTIQASHSIRYIHVKSFWPPHEEPMEGWVEFDATGNGRNFRMHMPAWTDPWGHDGDKVIVWKDNKAHIWVKKKNIYGVVKDNEIADMIFKSIEQFDPKTALIGLQLLKSEGKVDLDIDLPEDKASPIIVTATILEKVTEDKPMTNTERGMTKLFNMWKSSENDISKLVLFVDQATKLVTSIEFYEQREGQEHCVFILEYYDYNQPIAAEMFVLEDEIPADVLRVDQTIQDVGLSQGTLTNEEIGVELIRQFLQALIDQDYAKAGKLWGGVPAERMKKAYGQIRFLRIISIDKPVPCSDAEQCDNDHFCTGLHVTCEVEIEENGRISLWKPRCVSVRQVHGQPDRWEIISGFRGI